MIHKFYSCFHCFNILITADVIVWLLFLVFCCVKIPSSHRYITYLKSHLKTITVFYIHKKLLVVNDNFGAFSIKHYSFIVPSNTSIHIFFTADLSFSRLGGRKLLHPGCNISGTLLRHLRAPKIPPLADPLPCSADAGWDLGVGIGSHEPYCSLPSPYHITNWGQCLPWNLAWSDDKIQVCVNMILHNKSKHL